MLVFTLFFGRLAQIPSDGIPYPLFAFAGLVLWTSFSTVITQGGQSLISNSNMITKVFFPRLTLPFSSATSGALDLLIGLSFLLLMSLYYGVLPALPALLAPLFLLQLVLLTAGVSLSIAALNVSYRDVKYVLPLLIQLGLFVTPVIYPASFIPDRFQGLLAANPLTGIVVGFRDCVLLGQWPDLVLTGISLAETVVILWFGLVYFRKVERSFADII
jgi:lipopolysaccharide transport system permease protein